MAWWRGHSFKAFEAAAHWAAVTRQQLRSLRRQIGAPETGVYGDAQAVFMEVRVGLSARVVCE